MSDTEIPVDTGDFRLLDRKVVEAVKLMPERDRFLRGMISWVGFRQVAVPYSRAARRAGESKYPLRKMLRFALDGIVSFSAQPLRLATWCGALVSTMAVVGIIYAIAMRVFTDHWVSGWTFMVVAMLFLGGIQLLFLGVIGEYIARIYQQGKERPLYLVSHSTGFEPENNN
jgi:glycosyltransferase involved in cell wall biosynthesis